MSYTAQGLPFASGSHESYQAAVKAATTRGAKTQLYMRFLAKFGARTDHEAAAFHRWPLSSLCSIRGNLMHAGLVEKSDQTRPSPYGLQCRVPTLAVVRGGSVCSVEDAGVA